jgi:hypothetical protein
VSDLLTRSKVGGEVGGLDALVGQRQALGGKDRLGALVFGDEGQHIERRLRSVLRRLDGGELHGRGQCSGVTAGVSHWRGNKKAKKQAPGRKAVCSLDSD